MSIQNTLNTVLSTIREATDRSKILNVANAYLDKTPKPVDKKTSDVPDTTTTSLGQLGSLDPKLQTLIREQIGSRSDAAKKAAQKNLQDHQKSKAMSKAVTKAIANFERGV